MHEQQAYTFGQFSDLAKNWHLCIHVPIIVNMSLPPPLDPKSFDIQRIFLKRSKRLGYKNWIGGWGVCELCKNNVLSLLISTQKLYFGDNDAISDVITTDMISAGIHLLNYLSLRHIQLFSFLDLSTGPICRLWS